MSGGVIVVGAGLAGAEASWQLVRRGVPVVLYEMRPRKCTPAHKTGDFAELVCSNSLRAEALTNAVGLLKEEMRRLGSLIMACADAHRVPAGGALAVDRQLFAAAVTERLTSHRLVTVCREEITTIPTAELVILATGPLTSDALADELRRLTGQEHLYFFDAVAPIVTLESIDQDRVFRSSRYGRGDPAYLNCPMSREEYERFWEALVAAERATRHTFERETHFEGCLPVEVIAARGRETLLYGPLKPVGLVDPRTGERPYAVVQLRQDNRAGTLYNLVGFQTNLKWGEQRRVFSMIPGLEQAEFVRYGVMHRNTYINAPVLLSPNLMLKSRPGLFIAGQLSGVEGYVESAAAGLVAGLNAARLYKGLEPLVFPPETAHGALINYIVTADPANFQPMNVNFGLFPPLPGKRVRRRPERNLAHAQRALERLAAWLTEKGEG
ncbi:methylenetetrahydrofolate--tRNA-(uracil(54)-C(5))-methyltransferase (FADH(2)-oxidizing) TrmFO [Candidatus Desulforudis audaxviator]|uniref:Methylenetetrahydrofolate--tRNA-(uracil-5-)-methyltransferase TrmFO n=1 Tax=Desulforudis audaxviator (strain MP104C) TaxID=477974 RepID=TRMFO_DESAP|nr:methylenetetrahydrofolate--tRNA-(uracil(54)-C(5))-methyltransferase (FADH(2)-oxidizing) TrmFO [Candidatus Desulforudis audaxviator]B1I258.1 RecName: Full=Methylenetetrahydrofolate--tRNA-(uracil-5-)-methyltransferase TrmFO; AltName: Full=Folate-dependent tRNA (uracil-5-)-methyltransferase; AltName: Full=Folate-dependent tRNA(M-5-U54)-methyltransferase [Candidatus Desulforudis audaxviator MP104C]ACA59135.1 gid protein [Candidatus Desulforudis audaxviator MP104C]AZK59203.1 tRNA:m(5)U-54 MTase gi